MVGFGGIRPIQQKLWTPDKALWYSQNSCPALISIFSTVESIYVRIRYLQWPSYSIVYTEYLYTMHSVSCLPTLFGAKSRYDSVHHLFCRVYEKTMTSATSETPGHASSPSAAHLERWSMIEFRLQRRLCRCGTAWLSVTEPSTRPPILPIQFSPSIFTLETFL